MNNDIKLKRAILYWDEEIANHDVNNLPDKKIIYSQISFDCGQSSWSIVYSFDFTPKEQKNFITKCYVSFLVDSAPHEKLVKGFQFDCVNGGQKFGFCEILED